MSTQFIEKNGKAEFAVVPIDEYNQLLEKAEELDDRLAFDRAMDALEVGRDELLPADVGKRLVSGNESPLKIWREFRGVTQVHLAKQIGISKGQMERIERRKQEEKA